MKSIYKLQVLSLFIFLIFTYQGFLGKNYEDKIDPNSTQNYLLEVIKNSWNGKREGYKDTFFLLRRVKPRLVYSPPVS